jgi:hypothetical protein
MKKYKLICRCPSSGEIFRIAYGDTPDETWKDERRQIEESQLKNNGGYWSGQYYFEQLHNNRYEPCRDF